MSLTVVRVGESLPEAFGALRSAAAGESFGFLDRLHLRWQAGAYGGDRRASLIAIYDENELTAIGAQTCDEYDPDPAHRRLRHFYVRPDRRRAGIGRVLAATLEADAFSIAPRLHLRATHAASMAFWDAMGFARVTHPNRTHVKARR